MQDKKHMVLYVDDDQDMLDSVRMILESNGYAMEEAGSAEEGLRKFNQVNPDFVLVDLMMEEIDSGTNFVKELKARGHSVPIYMLSSVGDQLNASTSYKDLGLDGVLQKPIAPRQLLSLLAKKLQA